MQKPLWIVVASTSTARIFEKSSDAPYDLIPVQSFSHPASRMHGQELSDDRPGHSPSGRTVLAPRSEPREHEHDAFARELAGALKAAVGTNRVGSLAIFASSHFLGELRGHLDAGTSKLVVASHAVDMTMLDPAAIKEKLHSEFHL